MKIYYDFHIHSALSPCGSDDMTPENIVAMASVKGLNAIALCDHNAIDNVLATMECGIEFGVTVLPAMEVQTAEDIHILAIFPTFEKLKAFFETLSFPNLNNNTDIFGKQLIIDKDNNVTGEVERMLLIGATEGIYEISSRIISMGGKAVLAHIDRDANGILAILGAIPSDLEFSLIELSHHATADMRNTYCDLKHIVDSDAHYLQDISGADNYIEASSESAKDIFNSL